MKDPKFKKAYNKLTESKENVKIKFFYYDGKATSRKPNEKEKKFLEVYKDIIGFDVELIYRQDALMEWSCGAESENPAHNYFIKSDYRFDDYLTGGSGYNKLGAFDDMISIFREDLRTYYQKFASHYNYFSSR